MGRNKKSDETPALPVQASAPELVRDALPRVPTGGDEDAPERRSAEPPLRGALVEYSVAGEPWRCGRLELLAAEMEGGLTAATLPLFHQFLRTQERGWLVVRRLYGLQPVKVKLAADPDDRRLWDREELQTKLGLSRLELQAELDVVRGGWQAIAAAAQVSSLKFSVSSEEGCAAARPYHDQFDFRPHPLLKEFDFVMRFRSQEEGEWFASRVADFEKVLREKFAAGFGRNALMLELRIRRLDRILNDMDSENSVEWRQTQKSIQEMQSDLQTAIEKILKMCPWAQQIAGRYAFTGVVSDITAAIQAFQKNGDNALIDGIFTATEIQVECRRSVQVPIPRYRAGLVVLVAAARQGLWNPHWVPPFEDRELRRLDAAWQAALVACEESQGKPLVDLEAVGPEGEFPELYLPSEMTEKLARQGGEAGSDLTTESAEGAEKGN